MKVRFYCEALLVAALSALTLETSAVALRQLPQQDELDNVVGTGLA